MKDETEMRDQLDWPRPWLALYEELGIEPIAYDERTLGAIVAEAARDLPDATALIFAGQELSYRWLDDTADRLAAALFARGIGRGDVVGLHMPNLPQYAAAVVAVSRLGAIGSGVSPLLAPTELQYQLTDSRAVAVLTMDALAPALAAMPTMPEDLRLVIVTGAADSLSPSEPALPDTGPVRVTSWRELLTGGDGTFTPAEVDSRDTWMIQYTGGTTGRPKGAQLSHRTLINNPRQFNAYMPPRRGGEVVASAFPMFHVAGLSVAISALINANAVTMVPDPRDVRAFCETMIAFPPTAMSAVPALYDMLLAEPLFAEVDFSGLRIAATGAAPMPGSTARKLAAVIGEGRLTDAFGMTETGPCYTFHPPSIRKEGTIGIPMLGAEVRIVDAETGTKTMPFGEAGEITTSGEHVMKGYLNLPEESARALREHGGRQWMCSGDIGSMDQEGYITLHDRAKDMLIVGGFKVFSVELEDHLKDLDVVAACAVVGTPDPAREGNEVVHLYVEPSEAGRALGRQQLEERVLGFCRETMSPYKVPKLLHVVDAIPLTPVGKIDKKVLRSQAVREA